jgi:uncharacterized protein YukE
MPSPTISVVADPEPVAQAALEDPVSAEVRSVIELYATQLAKVSFPDIDAQALRRQADDLRSEAKTVARAKDALDAALANMARRTAALAETASRAVAYARIYSDAHPDRHELAGALAALAPLTRPAAGSAAPAAASPTGKKRGRPPKRSAELFEAAAADAVPVEDADETDSAEAPAV